MRQHGLSVPRQDSATFYQRVYLKGRFKESLRWSFLGHGLRALCVLLVDGFSPVGL